jgi:hypothetical protein
LAEAFPPITPEEVSKSISRFKPSSAPGLDGIRKRHLKDQRFIPVLAKFFNLLMMTHCTWLHVQWESLLYY